MEVEVVDKGEGLGGHAYKVGGYTIYVYFPENTEGSVGATLHFPGSGEFDDEYKQVESLYSGDASSNNAFIAFMSSGTAKNYIDGGNEAIAALLGYFKEQGIDITIDNVGGFSLGGGQSVDQFYYLLKNGDPANETRKTLIMYDPFGARYVPYDDVVELMKKNDSRLVTIVPNDRLGGYLTNPSGYSGFISKVADEGLDTVIISTSLKHGQMTQVGLYSGLTKYLDGTIGLEDVKNEYQVGNITYKANLSFSIPIKNENGGHTWKTYSLTELQNAMSHPENIPEDKASEYRYALDYLDGMVTVEVDITLLDELETISGLVESLEIVEYTPSYESTSQLLGNETTLNARTNEIGQKLNEQLKKDILKIKEARDMYKDLDTLLAEEASAMCAGLKTAWAESTSLYRTGFEAGIAEMNPEPTAPTKPQPTAPTKPEPTAPTEPEPTAPTEPEPTAPTEPEPTAPTEPEPTAPTEPEPPTQPSTPAEPTGPVDQTTPISTPPRKPTPEHIQEPSPSFTIETPVDEPGIVEAIPDETIDYEVNPWPTYEPDTIETATYDTQETSKKGMSNLGKIGIGLGVAGAAAAGLYGAKKYYENKTEDSGNEQYGSEEVPSLDEQYAGFNRRIEQETVETYKASTNDANDTEEEA